MERDFKGIWIERDIWLDQRLNALEKILLAEINSLNGGSGCYASNQYLADFCQCSPRTISTALTKLSELGYIKIKIVDGNSRYIKTLAKIAWGVEKIARGGRKNCEGGTQKLQGVLNNKDEKYKGIITPLYPPTGENAPENDFFTEFWKAYPKKVDKKGAERSFNKIKGIDKLMPQIMEALEKQKRSEQWQREGGRFIPNPTTWLNQERWNDTTEIKQDGGSFDTDEFLQAAISRTMGGAK